MTELQQVEFNLLKIFINICKKHNIKYFLVCGSALGAAKYNGFIPWDDDIDVGLPRGEYERFLEIAPKELPQWCFLQNYRTDSKYIQIHSKLRDSRTTFIEKGSENLQINHGIYIDVFPLDGYPKSEKEQKLLDKKKKYLSWKRYCALSDVGDWKVRIRNPVLRMLGYHKRTAKTLEKLDRLISQYPVENSDIWCNHGNWQGKLEYAPRWHYGEGTCAIFEGLEVCIPQNFDEYLTQKYGDWRSDLPENQKKSHHYYLVCDVNKPYTKYIKHK